MEQVPNIAMFLHESRPNFPAAFSRYLVPIVVRYLTDPNNQVSTDKVNWFSCCYLSIWFCLKILCNIDEVVSSLFDLQYLKSFWNSVFAGAKDQPGSLTCSAGTRPHLQGRHGDQSLSCSTGPHRTQQWRRLQNRSCCCKIIHLFKEVVLVLYFIKMFAICISRGRCCEFSVQNITASNS